MSRSAFLLVALSGVALFSLPPVDGSMRLAHIPSASVAPRPVAYTDYSFDEPGPFFNLDMFVTWTSTPSHAYIYPAFQFAFEAGSGGYMGTQLVGDVKKAAFSIWDISTGVLTAELNHPNCQRFSHEGTGTMCLVEYEWFPGREYRLRLRVLDKDASGENWLATILETETEQETTIGVIHLADTNGYEGFGWLRPVAYTFLEYFAGPDTCEDSPYSRVVWRGPYADAAAFSANKAAVHYNVCPNTNVTSTGCPVVGQEAGEATVRTMAANTDLWASSPCSPSSLTPTSAATARPTATLQPVPPAPGQMHHCPEPGKWSIAVWSGQDAMLIAEALASCPQQVEIAYRIDPDSQSWARYFRGHPEMSNLDIIHDGQGIITLAASASASWITADEPMSTATGRMLGCPQLGRWAISVWTGSSATPIEEAVRNCTGAKVVAAYWIDPQTQAWRRYFDGQPDISDLKTLDNMQGIIALGGVPTDAASLTVHFIDVGQGDATLIESENATILIDGGEAAANVAEYLRVLGIREIDLVVATHPHADHIGGLIDVLDQFDVHEIWTNGDTADTQSYSDFAAAVATEQTAGATYREVSRGYSTNLDGVDLEVLSPATLLSGDTNQDSLVLEMTCGWVDILMMGDATIDTEASMLSDDVLRSVEVLKVGYHGSNTSTSQALLGRVSPEDAVISVGSGNTYGHPHQETLDRLANAGVRIHRTDEEGTIVLTSDCGTYAIGMGNYAPNPSFEVGTDSPQGWTLSWQTTWDSEQARRGHRAVKWEFPVQWSEQLDSCAVSVTHIASVPIAIDPDTTYLFSFWQRGSTTDRWVSSLTGYLSLFDSQGAMLQEYYSPVGVHGSEDWVKTVVKIGPHEFRTWPEGAASVEIKLSNGLELRASKTEDCQGEVLELWADDIFFAPID